MIEWKSADRVMPDDAMGVVHAPRMIFLLNARTAAVQVAVHVWHVMCGVHFTTACHVVQSTQHGSPGAVVYAESESNLDPGAPARSSKHPSAMACHL